MDNSSFATLNINQPASLFYKKKNKRLVKKNIIFIILLLIIIVFHFILIYKIFKKNNRFINNNSNIISSIKANNFNEYLEQQFNLSKEFIKYYSLIYNALTDNSYRHFRYSHSYEYNFNDKEKKGMGICSIGKRENLYAKEFVEYYRKLGIKKIIIIDNNDINDERFQDVLENYIKEKFVEIIDIRGIEYSQKPAFNYCYRKYRNEFDFMAFIDFDEYITIKNNKSINDFLYDSKFKKCQSIFLNWEMYGDNDLIKYDNRPMIERFTKPYIKLKRGKCIVRADISNLLVTTGHIVGINVNNFCDSNGNRIFPREITQFDFKVPENSEAYIKHFYTKTVEEFCIKVNKGSPHFNNNIMIIQSRISRFMKYNKMTNEKKDIIEKCIGIKIKGNNIKKNF